MPFQCKELESICVVDAGGRQKNLDLVLSRGLPTVQKTPERAGQLAIVASGPSVRDYLDELRSWTGEIWAINGAYDYLLDEGIVPHGFFAIDPLPELADYVRRPQRETTFFVAATSDVSVFDALEGFKIKTFFPFSDDVTYPEGAGMIGGGTTAVTRAPYLALVEGWRDITLFGCDSSYDGGEYCYQWGRYKSDIDAPKLWLEINGEGPFQSEIGLMKQMSQMAVIIEKFRGMLKIRCGGLMAAYLRAPMSDPEAFEVAKKEEADEAHAA
jgi:hypothetical protein